MAKKERILDTRIQTWYWTQHLATLTMFLFLFFAFKGEYFYTFRMGFNVTLFGIVSIVSLILTYLYVLGFYVDLEVKTYTIMLLIPYPFLIFELFMLFIARTPFNITIMWLNYLKVIGIHLVMTFSLFINYMNVEITTKEIEE